MPHNDLCVVAIIAQESERIGTSGNTFPGCLSFANNLCWGIIVCHPMDWNCRSLLPNRHNDNPRTTLCPNDGENIVANPASAQSGFVAHKVHLVICVRSV